MKRPREVLLERHRDARRSLDAVRRNALAALPAPGGANRPQPGRREGPLMRAVFKAWRELIWPSRRAWAGMAALWLAVLAANVEMRAASGPAPGVRSAPAREVARALAEQRRLLAELLSPVSPPPVEAARPGPRPRSERSSTLKVC